MLSLYLLPFITSFILSVFLTEILIKLSKKLNISFKPKAQHIHNGNISRLGGAAIIAAFIIAIFVNSDLMLDGRLQGFLIGVLLILVFGILDDFFSLSPLVQLLFQLLIALEVILSGVKVDYLANPLGGAFRLDAWNFSIGGADYSVLGSFFIIFWIIFLVNSLNWADGLDGLLAGTGAIGAVALFFLSISSIVNQPPLGIISIILFGALLGFTVFNFFPARIFMGTAGSMFVGFALAVISIFSGAKLATLILVLSVPILDAMWVIIQRIREKKSIFRGDQSHLHYRLLNLGFSQRQIVIFYYAISAFFAFLALNANSLGKLFAFLLFAVIMIGILAGVSYISAKNAADGKG